MKTFLCCCMIVSMGILITNQLVWSDEKPVPLDKLPQAVLKAVKDKYPQAELISAEEEEEDGKIEYEVVIRDGKKKLELMLTTAGVIESTKELKSEARDEGEWVSDFAAEKADLTSTGRNPYFILEPGYQLEYADGKEKLIITVLDETKMVDGVETRVVEERETEKGKLVEVSRNYFAISKKTNSVYYFGEDVDMYKRGEISSHEGSWLSGEKKARFGMVMPGKPIVNARYYQEMAPDVAMDRSEIVSVTETITVPAGEFKDCLKIKETTPLEPADVEFKIYAPNVGLIVDGKLKLVKYGKVDLKK